MMRKNFFLFLFCSLAIVGYSQSNAPLSIFDPLVGKTWKAEGSWGDGSVFKQEVTFEYDLNKGVVYANAMGFVDENRTQWGKRNHGIRKWDAASGQLKFWEFDVFGGLTEGRIFSEGKNIYYQYEYSEGAQKSLITDGWEQIDEQTYAFKVGHYEDGQWKQLFLDTRFTAAPLFTGSEADFRQIMDNIALFSATYMKGDHEALAQLYTSEGMIMPGGSRIIKGRAAIASRWKQPEGAATLHHKVSPVEIHILDDIAYDYGYYEGRSRNPKGEEFSWKGKYVIIWKKIEGKWLIELDIWNQVRD